MKKPQPIKQPAPAPEVVTVSISFPKESGAGRNLVELFRFLKDLPFKVTISGLDEEQKRDLSG